MDKNNDKRIKELGNYQYEWLSKYGMIKLNEWRFEILNQRMGPNWYYVGKWCPTEIESYPSDKDGGYKERTKNLTINPYFYWS